VPHSAHGACRLLAVRMPGMEAHHHPLPPLLMTVPFMVKSANCLHDRVLLCWLSQGRIWQQALVA
jgi:hypothetical protein